MASRKRKKSANQISYEKELKRIKAFVRRAEKRGFRFDKTVIPERPPRYTKKSVESLKEMTANKLYKKATYLSDTGAIVSGYQGRKLERQLAASRRKVKISQKTVFPVAKATTVVLNNVRELIGRYPTKGAIYLNKLLEHDIAQYGEDAVAKSLAMAPEDAVAITKDIVYYIQKGSDANRAIRAFADLIRGYLPDEKERRELGEVLESTEDGTDYED